MGGGVCSTQTNERKKSQRTPAQLDSEPLDEVQQPMTASLLRKHKRASPSSAALSRTSAADPGGGDGEHSAPGPGAESPSLVVRDARDAQ